MSSDPTIVLNPEHNGQAESQRLTLLDRMDPDIGDAAAGIGVLMTELVRRSLRGGVSNIDQHLQAFAQEQTQQAIDRELPRLVDLAESTSRQIADAAVTQITAETKAEAERLTSALEATDQRLQESLTGVEHRVTDALVSTDQRLTTAITQTESRIHETSQTLSSAVDQVQSQVRDTARGLDERLVAAREESAVSLGNLKNELKELSKRSWDRVNSALEELRGQTAGISPLVERMTHAEGTSVDLRGQLARMQSAFDQQVQSLQDELEATREALAAATERVHKLEERGVIAWFRRLFRRKPKVVVEEEN